MPQPTRRTLLAAALALVAAACRARAGADDTVRADSARTDTTARATEQCVRGEPEPALHASAAARPRFERRGKLRAVEDIQLDDTTSLQITHGGCAHYVETYAFMIHGAARDTADARYWLERGAEYLAALPAVETRRVQLEQMVAALKQAAAAPTPYKYGEPISVGEMATVVWTVRAAGQGVVVVEITYDFAL